MKLPVILFCCFIFSFSSANNSLISDSLKSESYTKESLQRKARPLGIGFHAFGPSLAYGAVYVDYSVIPLFELEIGTDIRSFFGGLNVYPFANKIKHVVNPYIGAFFNYTTDHITYELTDAPSKGFKGYFPAGVKFISKSGIIISPEIAFSIPEYSELNNIYWGIKIGYKFKIMK